MLTKMKMIASAAALCCLMGLAAPGVSAADISLVQAAEAESRQATQEGNEAKAKAQTARDQYNVAFGKLLAADTREEVAAAKQSLADARAMLDESMNEQLDAAKKVYDATDKLVQYKEQAAAEKAAQ